MVVKCPEGTSNRSPLFEKVHSKDTLEGSALTRQPILTDSSNEAPTTVTPLLIHTGASVREYSNCLIFQRDSARVKRLSSILFIHCIQSAPLHSYTMMIL